MIVLTPAQMREADAKACAIVGDDALMQAAGRAIAAAMREYTRGFRAIAFAGGGNNGGDAFAALAELGSGFQRTIYAEAAPSPSAARLAAEARARNAGVRVLPFPASVEEAAEALRDADIAAIGLVGTAARYPLPQKYTNVIEAANTSGAPCVAIDIPPGVDGEMGATHEPALCATATITLGAMKSGLLLCDPRLTGALRVADIGMPRQTLVSQEARYAALTFDELLGLLPHRARNADKRSAGAALVVAGSEQFPGAAVLCAMGAARAGAGYVTVATPAGAASAIRAHLLEQVVVTIAPDENTDDTLNGVLDLCSHASALAIGPGLGLDDRTGVLVRGLVERPELPIVADASALFHFSKHLDLLRGKPIVLTPHEGEFARLSGKGTIAPGTRVERLREFVDRVGVTTLLKGDRTLIYDGKTMHVNTSGTPALATAGTGDVLTGIIATLLSQGLPVVDAARAGAFWHGIAARYAQERRGPGVIARDVYESLGPSLYSSQHVEPVL